MSQLMPQLFDLRYADLVELGRSRLPAIAPDWTDFNAHDPGITLLELLAWVAEAQIYSLARMRTDERAAYAALFGLRAAGNRPAQGIVWSDPLDPGSPAKSLRDPVVLRTSDPVRLANEDAIEFRSAYDILWIPGRIVRLRHAPATGMVRDLSALNEHHGAEFQPFGDTASPRDVLSMDFEARSNSGIFPTPRATASGALWIIGVRTGALPTDTNGALARTVAGAPGAPSPLAATLFDGTSSYPVPVVADTSHGMLSTGILALDLSQVSGSPGQFTLELRAPRGLPRPPRVLWIEPNVLPITQKRQIRQEAHQTTGQPDQVIGLKSKTLCFDDGESPIEVDLANGSAEEKWRRCDRLEDQGPDDAVFEFDAERALVTFGNGVNGRIPPEGQKALLSYAVSEGPSGNVARNRKWSVARIPGIFGVNIDPLAGGAEPEKLIDLRRRVRQEKDDDHALISTDDIVKAALALPRLEVARAWVAQLPKAAAQTGTVTLVAMQERPGGVEPDLPPELPRWLAAVRSQLAPRMPLGTRLRVIGPEYVDFTIRAQVLFEPGRDPARLLPSIVNLLRRRLALTATDATGTPRPPGSPLSSRDVTAWIRTVEGVAGVVHLVFVTGNGAVMTALTVPGNGLPRVDLANSQFTGPTTPSAGAGSMS